MKKGFTLVELLVVVAILGVLAAVGIVSYNGYMSKSKVTVIKKRSIVIINLKCVGATGFEPATPATPLQCATGLRHAPN